MKCSTRQNGHIKGENDREYVGAGLKGRTPAPAVKGLLKGIVSRALVGFTVSIGGVQATGTVGGVGRARIVKPIQARHQHQGW